jgi:hypothetical protein
MCPDVPNLLDNLSIQNWYKYLLYVAGVLLVLVIIVGSKIPETDVISFSLWTIFLCTILWIIDGVLKGMKITEYNINSYIAGRTIVHVLVFLLWILIAFKTLL